MTAPPPGTLQVHRLDDRIALVYSPPSGAFVSLKMTPDAAREVARQIVEAADAIEGKDHA